VAKEKTKIGGCCNEPYRGKQNGGASFPVVAVVTKKTKKNRGSFITLDRCCDNHRQRKKRGAKFPWVAGMTKRDRK
jgi:hypothetical protein